MKSACLSAYHLESYIRCFEDMGYQPLLTFSLTPLFDRAEYGSFTKWDLVIPDAFKVSEQVSLHIGYLTALHRFMDYENGLFTCSVKSDGVFHNLIIPIEYVVAVRSSEHNEFLFSLENFGTHFIKHESKPQLRLVK